MHENDNLQRYKNLFKGNPNAYGVYVKGAARPSFTEKKPLTDQQYANHLQFEARGLGVIPIIDDKVSGFGVLDFDNHKEKNGIKLIELEKKVRNLKYPLVVCRSKSGGAHGFLFGLEPLNTKLLIRTLQKMAENLTGVGEKDIEIFPKQARIDKHQIGNWINLPYLECESTERYAIVGGQKLGFLDFLREAESKRISNATLSELGTLFHNQAPPCIQIMLKEKMDEGNRNNALYAFAVYAKKAFPEDWDKQTHNFNMTCFEEPLDLDEANTVINSISINDYKYKCGSEPCKSRCDSAKCVKLKFGITDTDKSNLLLSMMPDLGRLSKYLMDPVKYELTIRGIRILFTTDQLMDFRLFKKVIFERLDLVLRKVEPKDWHIILDGLVKNIQMLEVPDDASRDGIIRSFFLEYIRQANLEDSGEDLLKRKLLLTGSPIVQRLKQREYKRYVLFKGVHFIQYVQNKRLGGVLHNEIWFSLKRLGVISIKLRCDGVSSHLWMVGLKGETKNLEFEDEDIDAELMFTPPAEVDEIKDLEPEF